MAITTYLRSPGANTLRGRIYVLDTCVGAPAGCTPASRIAAEFSSSEGQLDLFDRALSSDGRFLTYRIENSGTSQAHLADTCLGAPAGCVASDQTLTNNATNTSVIPRLTPSGRFLAFARTLQEGALSSGYIDAYDTCLAGPAGCVVGQTRVSESAAGVAVPGTSSSDPTISADGALVAFTSNADQLVPGDANGKRDIFLARSGLN